MIQNVWCVGRNYADHAKELGNAVPTEPMFFLKAGSSVTTGERLEIPLWAKNVHHELEIAFEFGPELRFSRMGLALDLTERTLQEQLKSKGQPWTLAKSFRGSCPLSPLVDFKPGPWSLELRINGEMRQSGKSEDMIFSPEILRDFALRHFPVVPGDILLSGTPAGVGPLKPGDQLQASLTAKEGALLRTEWMVK